MDFIDDYLAWSEGESSDIFRLWSAITCVSGVLERRVWTETRKGALYPNLFTMLVAEPGVGKDMAINPVHELWSEIKGLHVAPDSMSSASMADALLSAKRKIITKGLVKNEYHSLLVAAPEFIVFCPAHDNEFLGRLNDLFNCRAEFSVSRKYFKDGPVVIKRPCLTMLSSIQPKVMKTLFPEEAWGGGFTSRLILVYSGAQPPQLLFGERPQRTAQRDALKAHLRHALELEGRFEWDADAIDRLQQWHLAGGLPKPTHPRLQHYCTRRTTMHAPKLAMIASASRGDFDQRVALCDVERAIEWLLRAEGTMPDVFRSMAGHADADVISDLHYVMWEEWSKHKKPISLARMLKYLSGKVATDKQMKIIELACLMHTMKQVAPQMYEPLPLSQPIGENL